MDSAAALRQIEYAGRVCYNSTDRMTASSAPDFIRSLIRRGHLSPLEFAGMTAELVTSRDVMAELTRHRLSSFCVESQRYVRMRDGIGFIRPLFAADDASAFDYWSQCMRDAEQAYLNLLDSG